VIDSCGTWYVTKKARKATEVVELMLTPGISIRRFPDYFASLDRLFWNSTSFDSQLLVDDLPIDSSSSIDLEASIDRFSDWD
jgi:hypothetical protein